MKNQNRNYIFKYAVALLTAGFAAGGFHAQAGYASPNLDKLRKQLETIAQAQKSSQRARIGKIAPGITIQLPGSGKRASLLTLSGDTGIVFASARRIRSLDDYLNNEIA
jgi:hypothetical protein